jgi:TIR domain/Domain of unknown function (DUF4062)
MSKIYLSSVSRDLTEYREAVAAALRDAGHEVFLSEYLGPYTASAMLEALFSSLDDSDAWVGIFGQEYGPVIEGEDNPMHLSIAEREYQYAKTHGIPFQAFLMSVSGDQGFTESSDPMEAFLRELRSSQVVNTFSSPQELSLKVVTAVASIPLRSFDVFLSHNSQDREAVGKIAAHLQNDGIRVWWDKGSLLAGDEWKSKTDSAFDRAHVVAVFIGPNGMGPLQSNEVQKGLARAANGDLRLIPVLLPRAIPVPSSLSTYQWVDFRQSIDNLDAYGQLKNAIGGISGNVQAASPQPGPILTSEDLQMLPELLFRLVARLRERPEMLQSLEVTAFWAAVHKVQAWAFTIEDLRALNAELASEPAPGALWAAWIRNTRGTELAALVQHPPSPVVA